jgi:hypothetical protein
MRLKLTKKESIQVVKSHHTFQAYLGQTPSGLPLLSAQLMGNLLNWETLEESSRCNRSAK